VLIANNTLEDACGTTPNCIWISTGVQICGNHLTGPPGSAVLDLNRMQTGSIHDNSIAGGYMKAPASGRVPANPQ
jgi:hypothetical protein